ncbi:hypothetical protein UK23_17590 [Lentzea aerocolonigenes]|uniref:Uncharacterized protein n=1 Tax=Lentzea aerocolonigenes TaxID=68170 RepID=A0A0F0GXM6_LENAE|nr:hypothetical protein [Lentzea aerocolonigenes]KJK48214.1 hypothetical protein UK23_17590 [Lentzea aerocolonigenes]
METFDEAYVRVRHDLRFADPRRAPVPLLKMRYENTRTGVAVRGTGVVSPIWAPCGESWTPW